MYPRFCQLRRATPSSMSQCCHLAHCGLLGITQLCPLCCDEIAQNSLLARFRQPPAHEQSTTHSPCSSLHACLAECIVLHPLVGPYPTLLFTLDPLSKLSCRATFKHFQWAAILSVAVIVTHQLLAVRPHLLFREAVLPDCSGQESGSSSNLQTKISDGSSFYRLLFSFSC